MMFTFAQLEAAWTARNVPLVHQMASSMMAMGDTSAADHNKVMMAYAWSLEKMGRYGEALQYYRMAEVHDSGVGTKLTQIAALLIVRQARMLRKLGLQNAATGMFADLQTRARREILDADKLKEIQRQIDKALT